MWSINLDTEFNFCVSYTWSWIYFALIPLLWSIVEAFVLNERSKILAIEDNVKQNQWSRPLIKAQTDNYWTQVKQILRDYQISIPIEICDIIFSYIKDKKPFLQNTDLYLSVLRSQFHYSQCMYNTLAILWNVITVLRNISVIYVTIYMIYQYINLEYLVTANNNNSNNIHITKNHNGWYVYSYTCMIFIFHPCWKLIFFKYLCIKKYSELKDIRLPFEWEIELFYDIYTLMIVPCLHWNKIDIYSINEIKPFNILWKFQILTLFLMAIFWFVLLLLIIIPIVLVGFFVFFVYTGVVIGFIFCIFLPVTSNISERNKYRKLQFVVLHVLWSLFVWVIHTYVVFCSLSTLCFYDGYQWSECFVYPLKGNYCAKNEEIIPIWFENGNMWQILVLVAWVMP